MSDNNLEGGSLLFVVIGIMLVMGMFGGIVNFQLTAKKDRRDEKDHKDQNDHKDQDVTLLKSVSAGIAASILVPLFLHTISSNLLNSPKVSYWNLLVLAGFCLTAAISSRAFMKSLSERLLQQIEQVGKKVDEKAEKVEQVSKEVKEQAEKVEKQAETIEERYTEPDAPVAGAADTIQSAAEAPSVHAPDNKALEVLRSLQNSKFVVRTFWGIASETKLQNSEVEECLRELEKLGLAQILHRPKGLRAAITAQGTDLLRKMSLGDPRWGSTQ